MSFLWTCGSLRHLLCILDILTACWYRYPSFPVFGMVTVFESTSRKGWCGLAGIRWALCVSKNKYILPPFHKQRRWYNGLHKRQGILLIVYSILSYLLYSSILRHMLKLLGSKTSTFRNFILVFYFEPQCCPEPVSIRSEFSTFKPPSTCIIKAQPSLIRVGPAIIMICRPHEFYYH